MWSRRRTSGRASLTTSCPAGGSRRRMSRRARRPAASMASRCRQSITRSWAPSRRRAETSAREQECGAPVEHSVEVEHRDRGPIDGDAEQGGHTAAPTRPRSRRHAAGQPARHLHLADAVAAADLPLAHLVDVVELQQVPVPTREVAQGVAEVEAVGRGVELGVVAAEAVERRRTPVGAGLVEGGGGPVVDGHVGPPDGVLGHADGLGHLGPGGRAALLRGEALLGVAERRRPGRGPSGGCARSSPGRGSGA